MLLQCAAACGQNSDAPIDKPTRVNLSYFGNNLWNPGANIGLEHVYASTRRVNKKNKTFDIEKLLISDLGFFHDRSRQTPVFTHLGVARRRYRESGLYGQWNFSPLGIMRSFLPETWVFQQGTSPEQVRFAGRWYYAPVMGWALGHQQAKSGRALFAELSTTVLFRYNRSVMPLLNCKVGYRLPLKKALEISKRPRE